MPNNVHDEIPQLPGFEFEKNMFYCPTAPEEAYANVKLVGALDLILSDLQFGC